MGGEWAPLPERPGLYWDKCGGCHDGAGTFAPARLEVANGMLRVKKNGTALAYFLRRHPVRLTDDDLRVLLDTLASIVTDGGQFHRRCAVCHGPAEQFARTELALRDGKLAGRYSGRDIGRFLDGHARLDTAGSAFFLTVLKRLAARK